MSELWKHQKEAVERAKDLSKFALFFEAGTGKTRTTIEILRQKFNSTKTIFNTLIFCPPIVVTNWRKEWLQYTKIDPSKVICLTGTGKERLKKFLQHKDKGTIFITNYETLLMNDVYKEFTLWGPEVVVLDEVHRLKSHTAKKSKLMDSLINKGKIRPFVYALTGTPVLNSPMDLFMPFKLLDNGKLLGNNFYIFRKIFFYDANAGMPKQRYFPNWKIKPGSLEKMNELISNISMHVKKSECLDLPPLVKKQIYVDMGPEQKRIYLEMKRDFVAYINDKACVASLAIVKALRLMQISSGYIKLDDGTEVTYKNNPKLDALRELLEDLAPYHKVIVWAVWKNNYEQIRTLCEELNIKYVEVHGEITEKTKFSNVDAFNNDESIRVLIGHPGSGGIGINLVASNYSIFYSRTFSLEHSLQAEARNYRGGSEIHDKITRIDLVCEGTIDELVEKRLANKLEISDKVLKDISSEL